MVYNDVFLVDNFKILGENLLLKLTRIVIVCSTYLLDHRNKKSLKK